MVQKKYLGLVFFSPFLETNFWGRVREKNRCGRQGKKRPGHMVSVVPVRDLLDAFLFKVEPSA